MWLSTQKEILFPANSLTAQTSSIEASPSTHDSPINKKYSDKQLRDFVCS